MAAFGALSSCPACGAMLSAPTDGVYGDADCPRCGAKLWFVRFSRAGLRFMVARAGRKLIDVLAEMVEGEEPDCVRMVRGSGWAEVDSLDRVEVVFELIEAVERREFGGRDP